MTTFSLTKEIFDMNLALRMLKPYEKEFDLSFVVVLH